MKSIVWGNKDFEVSQAFGPGFNPAWYQYSETLGYPPGYHVALDIAMPMETPIYSLTNGRVKSAGFSDYFRPNPVTITTDDGKLDLIYGHLWRNVVNTGASVVAGQLIGYSGQQTVKGTMTPDGSGPHLHMEVRRNNNDGTQTAIEPSTMLQTGEAVLPPEGQTGTGTNTGTPATGNGGTATGSNWRETIGNYGVKMALGLTGILVLIIGLYATFLKDK